MLLQKVAIHMLRAMDRKTLKLYKMLYILVAEHTAMLHTQKEMELSLLEMPHTQKEMIR